MKKILLLPTAILLLFFVAGCGGGSNTDTDNIADKNEIAARYNAIQSAPNYSDVLNYINDPLTVSLTPKLYINGEIVEYPEGDDSLDNVEFTHDYLLQIEGTEDDLELFYGDDGADPELDIIIGSLVVTTLGNTGSTKQTIVVNYPIDPEDPSMIGMESMKMEAVIASSWSKSSGQWKMTSYSIIMSVYMVGNVE